MKLKEQTKFEDLEREFRILFGQLEFLGRSPLDRKLHEHHAFWLQNAQKHGEQDGKQSSPSYDDQSCLFEEKLRGSYKAFYTTQMIPAVQLLHKLRAFRENLADQVRHSPIERLLESIESIEKRFESLKIQLDRPHGETDANAFMIKNQKKVLFFLAFATMIEVSFNINPMLVLNKDTNVAFLMAFIITYILAITNHTMGKLLKQWKQSKSKQNWLVAIGSINLGLILVIGFLRAKSSLIEGASNKATSAFNSTLASLQMEDILKSVDFALSLVLVGFFSIVWTFVGFQSTDSNEYFAEAYKEKNFRLPSLQNQLHLLLQNEAKGLGISLLHNSLRKQKAQIDEMIGSLTQGIYQYGVLVQKLCIDTCWTYRQENEQNRHSDDIPYLWNFPPDDPINLEEYMEAISFEQPVNQANY